ncbi:MAG: radical SAM protein [Elusimicrobia bacterium]|nr:radical SAM protein [Elusimicrobiota bacterium]
MRIIGRKDYPGLASLYLAELRDNPDLMVEFVDTVEPGVPKKDKWVMMISTQFGCAVGCRMCDAGALGYRGNLTAEEMLAQVRHIAAQNPELDILRHPKVKIHFARMGEPALNPEVLEALRRLSAEFPGKGIIPTVSTIAPRSPMVGRFMDELLEIKDRFFSNGRFQLQISLHSASDDERSDITPIKKWGMEEIAAYGSRFVKPGDRKVTLNFALSGNGVRSSFVTCPREVTNEDLTPLPERAKLRVTFLSPGLTKSPRPHHAASFGQRFYRKERLFP